MRQCGILALKQGHRYTQLATGRFRPGAVIRNFLPVEIGSTDLNIAEILYETGAVRFRYARYLSADGSRWIRHGLFNEFHTDGQLIAEGMYEDGLEEGGWQDYHPNGQAAAQGTYSRGTEVGIWRYWNADGAEEASENRDDIPLAE